MPDTEQVTLLAPVSQSLDRQCVEVQWRPEPQTFSAAAAARIEERWAQCLAEAHAQGKTLFDGPITRLLKVQTDGGPGITLHLGPSCYKAFVVTRLRDRPWFDRYAPGDMTLALGNSALLTRGERALLGLRGDRVSAYAGRLHLFGGVLEALGTEELPANLEGLLAHLRKELYEEASLTAWELEQTGPRLLGLAHDEILGQPEIFWQWETRLELEQVAARLDAAEHAGACILGPHDMTEQRWRQLTPMARQAWRVWRQSL